MRIALIPFVAAALVAFASCGGGASDGDGDGGVPEEMDAGTVDAGESCDPVACAGWGEGYTCSGNRCVRCGPESAVVTYVYDGDTFYLEDGTRVRLLLVNTPEVDNVHTGAAAECYGNEARDYSRSALVGRAVGLSYDVSCQDKYGRLLAWVTLDGEDFNADLLRRGLASVMYVKPNGTSRIAAYREIQEQAKAAGAGMWGDCQDAGEGTEGEEAGDGDAP